MHKRYRPSSAEALSVADLVSVIRIEPVFDARRHAVLQTLEQGIESALTSEGFARVTGFGIGNVFDVSRTAGDPLPEKPQPNAELGATATGQWVDRRVSSWLIEQGVVWEKVPLGPTPDRFIPGEIISSRPYATVQLNCTLPPSDARTKMLVHEAAHYLGDHPGTGSGNEAEVAAEGSAYVVMQRFVIDPGQYSFNYIAHWFDERETLKRSLSQIDKLSQTMIAAIEGDGQWTSSSATR